MKVKIYWLLLWFPLLVSCDINSPCFEQTLSVTSLEDQYLCADTRYLPVAVSENYLIISSQEAFNHAVRGSCQPQIDFNKYSLLIGRKGLTSGNAPTVTYHVLLPKLSNDEKVKVEFEVKH